LSRWSRDVKARHSCESSDNDISRRRRYSIQLTCLYSSLVTFPSYSCKPHFTESIGRQSVGDVIGHPSSDPGIRIVLLVPVAHRAPFRNTRNRRIRSSDLMGGRGGRCVGTCEPGPRDLQQRDDFHRKSPGNIWTTR
jgi:hypothetical protein